MVAHEERAAGESKYSLYRLIRLNFDLITGFSLVPLQIVLDARHAGRRRLSLATYVVRHRLPAVLRRVARRGRTLLWDRDILAFFLIGIVLFGLGLLGEYVGRIYQQVRQRPRYMVRAVLERGRRADAST